MQPQQHSSVQPVHLSCHIGTARALRSNKNQYAFPAGAKSGMDNAKRPTELRNIKSSLKSKKLLWQLLSKCLLKSDREEMRISLFKVFSLLQSFYTIYYIYVHQGVSFPKTALIVIDYADKIYLKKKNVLQFVFKKNARAAESLSSVHIQQLRRTHLLTQGFSLGHLPLLEGSSSFNCCLLVFSEASGVCVSRPNPNMRCGQKYYKT